MYVQYLDTCLGRGYRCPAKVIALYEQLDFRIFHPQPPVHGFDAKGILGSSQMTTQDKQ